MSNNSTFDDDEMIQILIKKSFQVPATYEQTKWFNEAKGVSRTILEASDINSKTVPTTPIWGDASLNESDLDSYGIKLDPTQNFAASPYDEIHTFADATYLSYSKTISIDPGAYIDYTGTVMLFVKLKLDRMDAPSASAIAYTKYHIDSSQNSILDNAYQFNYNQQRNVLDSSGNFISLFKPYAYYLELSTDGGYNCDLLSPDHGNWFFDFKSGIITFSDDPNDSSFGADAKDVTNGDLYFTFVKYVGPRGLDKLISVDDDFDSTATSGFYKNQIVVDSSNSEIYLMKDGSWNSIGGGGGGGGGAFTIDGNDAYYNSGDVGIGTSSPSSALDVSGDANISSNLTVGGGIASIDAAQLTTPSLKFGTDTIGPTLSYHVDDISKHSTLILNGVNSVHNEEPTGGPYSHNQFLIGRYWDAAERVRGCLFDYSRNADGNEKLGINLIGESGNRSITASSDMFTFISDGSKGRLGINNDDPAYTLDVDGDANINSDLTVGTTSTDGIIYMGSNSIASGGPNRIALYAGGDNYGFGIDSYTLTYTSTRLHRFYYNGDSTPTLGMQLYYNNLTVYGTADITSDLTVGGNITTNDVRGNGTVLDLYTATGSSDSNSWLELRSLTRLCASGGIHFRPNGTSGGDLIYMTTGGYLGIGVNPSYPLEVNGSAGSKTGYYLDQERGSNQSKDEWWYSGEASTSTYNARVYEDSNQALSIYSSGSVGINSGKYYYLSDERIKTNIRDISDDEALVAFRKLQPKTYNYKDPLKSGYNSVYGFIAQEVEEVIPNSTLKDTGFIPNIYRVCEIDNSSNILTFHFGTSGETIEQFDLSINDIIQIEDVSKNMIERTIINIIDETSIQVNDEYIPVHTHDSSGIELSYNKVFVYGKKVDDLHRLGKDSIWTVAAAALQEVDRQQQSDKVRISELETEVTTLETEVTTLKTQASTFETQITELLARVSSLENNSSTTTDASDNTTTTDASDNTTTTDGS